MTTRQRAQSETMFDVTDHGVHTSRRQIPDDGASDEISELVLRNRRQSQPLTEEPTVPEVFSQPKTSLNKSSLQHHGNGVLRRIYQLKLVFKHHRHSCIRLLTQCSVYLLSFCLLFGASWAFFGVDALPPEGNVFGILFLFVSAVVSGCIMQSIKLPPLLGQLIAGIAVRNVPFISITDDKNSVVWSRQLRMLALTVILLRAGLGLDAAALRKSKGSVLLLAIVPCLVEASTYAVLAHYLMLFPWEWGYLLGFVMSAISPAVIVPSMLRLQQIGMGVANGIPTLIMAAASLDDVVAIAGVGATLSIVFTNASDLVWQVFQAPLEIVGGILYGIATGWLLWYIPNTKANSSTDVLKFRAMLLCGFGVFAVFGSQQLGYTGAGALGCLTAAFVAAYGWKLQHYQQRRESTSAVSSAATKPRQDVDAVSFTATNILAPIWSDVLQPLLFALIGAEILFEHLAMNSSSGIGLVIIGLALCMRLLASVFAVSVFGSSSGARLEWKERAFVALAWIPKATVQAAVGPLAYDMARRLGRDERELALGMNVLTFAVLAILITAPLGAVAINLGCDKLLRKSVDPNKDVLLNKSDRDVLINGISETGVSTTNVVEMRNVGTEIILVNTDAGVFAELNSK